MESIDDNFAAADLKLSGVSLENLGMAARWGRFIAIVGFVFCGLIVFAAFFLMATSNSYSYSRFSGYNEFSPMAGGIAYLVIVVLYFFPTLYLYQFATKMKQSLAQKDTVTLEQATSYLRRLFQFMGIVLIVVLSMYVLGILIGVFASLG